MNYQSLFRSLFLVILLSLSSQLFADPPTKCPDVSVLQKAVYIIAGKGDKNTWVALQPLNQYDTQETWLFGMVVQAQNRIDAFIKAYKALPALTYIRGPYSVLGVWFCDYTAGADAAGQARVINFS